MYSIRCRNVDGSPLINIVFYSIFDTETAFSE